MDTKLQQTRAERPCTYHSILLRFRAFEFHSHSLDVHDSMYNKKLVAHCMTAALHNTISAKLTSRVMKAAPHEQVQGNIDYHRDRTGTEMAHLSRCESLRKYSASAL